MLRRMLLPLCIGFSSAAGMAQDCGWSRIDHRVDYDGSGAWNTDVYRSIASAFTVTQVGAALWEGSESRFGRTVWQGVDAQIIASVTAAVGKRVFTRVRPTDTNNPCLWFEGGSNYSFPSREAAGMAALVTPYILEYASEQPAVYALALLPLYIGTGRIKNQAHWQTDVLAGWTIGALSGWFAHRQDIPFTIQLLPDGFAVGFKTRF
jgi:membrane-associated phospholipid phosphatase